MHTNWRYNGSSLVFLGLETENLMVNGQFSTNWYLRCSVSRSWSHVLYTYLEVIFHTDSENEFKIEKKNAQRAHFWQKPTKTRFFASICLIQTPEKLQTSI